MNRPNIRTPFRPNEAPVLRWFKAHQLQHVLGFFSYSLHSLYDSYPEIRRSINKRPPISLSITWSPHFPLSFHIREAPVTCIIPPAAHLHMIIYFRIASLYHHYRFIPRRNRPGRRHDLTVPTLYPIPNNHTAFTLPSTNN